MMIGKMCALRWLLLGALIGAMCGPALALDQVRLGKAVPNSFAFGAAEVGIDAKIFEKEGLDIMVSGFRGDAQLQQLMDEDKPRFHTNGFVKLLRDLPRPIRGMRKL